MKGLLLKDWYIIKKQYRFSLILVLGFIVFTAFASGENSFLTVYPCLFAGLIPTGLLSYDETSKWLLYSGALPYTRDQIVAGKYIIALILSLVIPVLCTCAGAVRMIRQDTFAVMDMMMIFCVCIAGSVLSAGLSMPFIFKFGVEKGRIAYFVCIGAVCAGSVIMANALDALSTHAADLSAGVVMPVMFLACAGIFALSWYLSTVFFRKREL